MRCSRLLLLVVVAGCCPASDRAKPDLYDYRSDYVLVVENVSLQMKDSSSPSDGSGVAPVEVDAASEHGEFSVRVTNSGRKQAIILFGRGNYVDEAGTRHRVELLSPAEGRAPCDPLRLRPGESGFCSLVPAGKDYKVRESCFVDFVYREPIIPWSVAELTKVEARRLVEELARKRTSVRIEIPISLNSDEGLLVIRSHLIDHPYPRGL
jgi:hypothetical protein